MRFEPVSCYNTHMRNTLTVFILAFTLTACAPVALLAGASIGGAVLYDKRGFKTILRDQTISQQIREHLDDDRVLRKRAHIAVTTFNRVVLLTGQAPTPELRQRVLKVTRHVRYIRRIFNQITLESPTPPITRTNDMWITAKVKTALLAKKGLYSTQIKVVTENGTVYLLGLTSKQQARLATETTRRVGGVLKVVKLFEYTR